MTRLISPPISAESNSYTGEEARAVHENYADLESANILFLPWLPLDVDHVRFLRGALSGVATGHKNIAYWPDADRISGSSRRTRAEVEGLRLALRSYAAGSAALLANLLPAYARAWRPGPVSFRPEEEEGRALPWRERNDRLHIDAFPARPTRGNRILRIFSNLNPTRARVWVTTGDFETLAGEFAATVRTWLPSPRRSLFSAPSQALGRRLTRIVRFPFWQQAPYDRIMLRFHDYLKRNESFQSTCAKQTWEFPPGSTWVAFTDMVPHAVVSGRGALERTFIVPHDALAFPERSPLRVLEAITGRVLTHADA